MDATEFHAFVSASAVRAVRTEGRISRLVVTQKTENLEPKIREPEMRHAMAQEAESRPEEVLYGIEVPTREKYRFTTAPGEQVVSARHDFVILPEGRFDADRLNVVELKKDQPALEGTGDDIDCPAIRKDIMKLILEKAEHGKSMIHICHAANSGTIPAVLHKYNAALWQGLRMSRPIAARLGLLDPFEDPTWFTLFVLVVHRRGVQGRNQPYLYRQHVNSFGVALQRVNRGDALFNPDVLMGEPLIRDEAPPE